MKVLPLSIAPLLALFVCLTVIFMAARAPRSWADHWTSPRSVARAVDEEDFGAAPVAWGKWDFLWIDDARQVMVLTRSSRSQREAVVDHGDAQQPFLTRVGDTDVGTWIHNYNGGTDLMAVVARDGAKPKIVKLFGGPQPIEHPSVFRSVTGTVDFLFSWQKYGNFDTFLTSLNLASLRPGPVYRLTHTQYYSFFPRGVADREGNVYVLHFEVCCHQQYVNVTFDRFDKRGRSLGKSVILYQISAFSNVRALPPAIGADLVLTPSNHIWGAFAGDGGGYVFETTPNERSSRAPRLAFFDGTVPSYLALAILPHGGYLFWPESFSLGIYIDTIRFDEALQPAGNPIRIEYEAARESGPHTVVIRGRPELVWEASPPRSAASFELADYRTGFHPSIAQRLGLGLGNPWANLGILLIAAVGLAVVTTVANMLWVFALTAVALGLFWILRPVPARWTLLSVCVAGALYLLFVRPGGPLLFLDSMPDMGLRDVPYGWLATLAALACTLWLGAITLRRIEALYRAGIMVTLAVYLFAYLEALVFVQQRLGFI